MNDDRSDFRRLRVELSAALTLLLSLHTLEAALTVTFQGQAVPICRYGVHATVNELIYIVDSLLKTH